MGVPQRDMLSPLFFNVLMEGMFDNLAGDKLNTTGDETLLIRAAENLKKIENRLHSFFKLCIMWKLRMNLDETILKFNKYQQLEKLDLQRYKN